ncbi:MAG TPA: sialidase family protein, partial [Acidimicrobiia bacterium]|nr:sialidase family protein [Acidimicrobiia bacterium]
LVAIAYEGRDADEDEEAPSPPTDARDLYFRASTDAGASFGPEVAVTPMVPGDQDEASVAIDGAGTVHVAYQDVQFVDEAVDYDEELNRIGYVRSPDAGVTFSEPVLLPGDRQASAPNVLVVGDTVHVVACDDRNEDDPADTADLLYWRGTDDGTTTTFGPPTVLARPEFKCDKPKIDGVGDDLHLAVGVEVGGLETDIWYFRSDNGGDGFEGPRNLSDNPLESVDPTVSVDPADSTDVHVSWTDKTVFLFASNGGLLPLEEGGLQEIANEDVVQYTGGAYRVVLDGSDVGLQPFRIDAMARLSDSEFVLSFTEPGPVPGVGEVDDSDLVLFTADTLGEHTSGTFSAWFDGSDVNLLHPSEDVDAADVVVNSDPDTGETTTVDLYFSTSGAFTTADGTTGKDEDVVACRGLTTGPDSACAAVDIAFDGSRRGLTEPGEDVDAFSFDGVGPGLDDEKFVSFYSTAGDFSIPSASGTGGDMLQCFHPEAEPAAENPLAECGGDGLPLLKTFDGVINVLGGGLTALEIPYKV